MSQNSSIYKKYNNGCSYSVAVIILILIVSDINYTKGFSVPQFWNLRRRVVAVESTLSQNYETVREFSIVESTWDSSKFPENGIHGFVINANPSNACESVKPPPNGMFDDDNNETNWFLLANDDDCNIETKKKNADDAGYLALIRPNNTNNMKTNNILTPTTATTENICNFGECEIEVNLENENETTTSEFLKTIDIYSLTIDEYDWSLLQHNFTYPNPYRVRIVDKPSYYLFIIAAAVFVIILITFIILCVISIRRLVAVTRECSRKRRIVRRNNLLFSTVRSLPIRKWTRALDTLSEENKVCTICTENFQDDEEIRVLPCCHIFHLICVDQWILEGRPFCKICKQNLLPNVRLTPPSDLSNTSDTLSPVYASCESTRLLISNQGAPGTSTLPQPLRVMAVMPPPMEVFDASFEAMLPLRSAADGISDRISISEDGKPTSPRIQNSPATSVKNLVPGGRTRTEPHSLPTSHNQNILPSGASVPNSNIYISDREDFV